MITIHTYTAEVMAFAYEGMTAEDKYSYVMRYGEDDPEPLEYETEKEAVEDWNDTGLYVGRSEVLSDGTVYRLACNCLYKGKKLMMASDFDLDRINAGETEE
jgi:hypothetical protein